jgi:hypothetical protein
MTVKYSNHGDVSNIHLRGSKPLQYRVNNVTDAETAQEQADALEQAVNENIAAFEAEQKRKADEAAALFAGRAEVALKLQDSKPGDTITLADGTVVRR